MKRIIAKICIALLLLLSTPITVFSDTTYPNYWKRAGSAVNFINSSWELGSTSSRIAKGWFTDLDTSSITIGGAVSGDLTVSGDAYIQGSNGVIIGVDEAGGTPNVAGVWKVFSAGDNAYYTTFTAGTQTANATYTLPTAMATADSQALLGSTAGVLSWGTNFGANNLVTTGDVNSGTVTINNGGALRTGTTASDTLLLQAYDNDTGPGYITFATLTAGNTPTFDLSSGVTIGSSYIYRVGGTDISVADGGTGASAWTQYGLMYADTTTSFSQITDTTAGKVLITNSSAAPSFSATPTVTSIQGNIITSLIKPIADGTAAIKFTKQDGTTNFIDLDTTNRKMILRELATATVGNPVYNSSDIAIKSSAWDTDGATADTHTWTQRSVPVDGNTTTSSLIWYQDTDGTPVKKMEINKDASTNTILRLQSTNDTFFTVNSSGTDRWSFGFDASPSANFFIANSGNPADTKLNLTSTSLLALGTGTVSGTYDLTLGLSVTNGNKTIGVVRQPTAATAGRNLTLNASGAYTGGTNLAGGDLYFASGTSTGNEDSNIFFQTPTAGGSGTSDNTPTTKMTITGNGISFDENVTFNAPYGPGTPTELTISGGSVTGTRGFHIIDTEGDAASDDLDTIVSTAYNESDTIILRTANDGRDVTVKNETGNIHLNGEVDFTMNDIYDRITLQKHSDGSWVELYRSNN